MPITALFILSMGVTWVIGLMCGYAQADKENKEREAKYLNEINNQMKYLNDIEESFFNVKQDSETKDDDDDDGTYEM